MPSCSAHPTIEATGNCDDCKAAICPQCTRGTLDGLMCPACARSRYSKRSAVTWLKIGGVATLVTGLAVVGLVLASRGNDKAKTAKPDTTVPEPPPTPEQLAEQHLAALRVELGQAPCDQAKTRELVGALSKAKKFADAVDTANAHFARCAPYPRLKWDVVYALQHLGRYAEAVAIETDLIADDWRDSDFWWWRGEDRANLGDKDGSIGDYRQSIANSEDIGGSQFAVVRILDVARAVDKPCEAVLALDYYVMFQGGTLGDDLQREANDLDTSAACDAVRGTGTITLPDQPTVTLKVTINGQKGVFTVDPTAGTTAIAGAFAQKAKLVGAAPIQTVVQGAIHTGGSATVDLVIAGGKAPATEVAIVDDLRDVDGVLGLSALWKFEISRDDNGALVLSGE